MAVQESSNPGTLGGALPGRLSGKRDLNIAEAVARKMVAPNHRAGRMSAQSHNQSVLPPDMGVLTSISSKTATDINDAKNLMQLLPDLELGMQILVSSILSPKDLTMPELSLGFHDPTLNDQVGNKILGLLSDHFKTSYKIDDELSPILEDALFLKGSYPLLVLPENVVDHTINQMDGASLESLTPEVLKERLFRSSIGVLGPATRSEPRAGGLSLEGLTVQHTLSEPQTHVNLNLKVGNETRTVDSHLRVVDDPSILKFPRFYESARTKRLGQIYSFKNGRKRSTGTGTSQEALQLSSSGPGMARIIPDGAEVYGRSGAFYGARNYRHEPIKALATPNQLRSVSVGHPLVMKVSPESLIPVHTPGDPSDHLGYFMLVDENGNPVNREQDNDYFNQLAHSVGNSGAESATSSMLASTFRSAFGLKDGQVSGRLDEMYRTYGDLVEHDLIQRLKNGAYGDNVEISRPTEAYRIMFTRSLAARMTQLVYIPAELMTYIAFDYNVYGVGVSLIQKAKILGGIRAVLTFSQTMAQIHNSIPRTKLGIQLDERDPDPTNTVEFLMSEYTKTRSNSYPLGATNPVDIISYLQNAAVSVEVEGNTRYPTTKMMIEDHASQRILPDTELTDDLRRRHLMSLGLTPEMVDAGADVEFATSIVNNNLLLAKRVMIYQRRLLMFLEQFMRTYTVSSSILMDQMREVVSANLDHVRGLISPRQESDAKVEVDDEVLKALLPQRGAVSTPTADIDELVYLYVESLRAELPQPDMGVLKTQQETFTQYKQLLTELMEAYFDPSCLPTELMGQTGEVVEQVKGALMAHFLRQYAARNHILPELQDLVVQDATGAPLLDLFDINSAHIGGMGRMVSKFLTKLAPAAARNNHDIQEPLEQIQSGSDGGGSDFGSDTGDTGGGFDDAGGGFDDGGFDTGFDDPPAGDDPDGDATTEVPEEPAAEEEEEEETGDTVGADDDMPPADLI